MGIPSPEQLQKLAEIIRKELGNRPAPEPSGTVVVETPKVEGGRWTRFKQSAQAAAQSVGNATRSPRAIAEAASKAAQSARETVEQKAASAKMSFKQAYPMLLKQLAPSVAQSALGQGLQAALHTTGGLTVNAGTVHALGHGITLGTTIAPVSAAVAPWIAAATIATQAGTIFDLYDLKEAAESQGTSKAVNYQCSCGRCAENLGYIIDKSERNVGLVGIGVATLGVSAAVKKVHSIGKYVYSKVQKEARPKEVVSRTLVASAQDGCIVAMATVFLLSGSWTMIGSREIQTMATAVAIIISDDGWDYFKGKW